MKNVFRIIALFCLLLLIIGCQGKPSAEVAEATVIATEAATETAVPPTKTATIAPTETATETAVPTATASSIPTNTPTATNTATPTQPPTKTPTTAPTATNTAVPVTATTAAPPPPPPPPPAPAPSGTNLLTDPSFEQGSAAWEVQKYGNNVDDFYTAADNPQFVHSGQRAAFTISKNRIVYFQRISANITPGTTYRAGAWVKIWSSSSENRLVSENPGDFGAQVCINTAGESEPNLDTSFCSGIVRPLDSWQFISVDGVASTERITILLVSGSYGPNVPTHNEAIWDDATLGTAPAAATATPVFVQPVRPNPVAFDGPTLRNSMNGVRSTIEQAGGLLDRLFNGESETCSEYQQYYDDAIRSATYSDVPEDWAGIYNDYIFAVENFLATNESIDALCDDGGGVITNLNYGVARTGINDSLNRLIPAIEAAAAK